MHVLPNEDTVIVGAGPIGLACAVSAKRRGVDPLVIDAGTITHSIVRYPIGMTFFTTPDKLEVGGHPLACSGQKPTREEALMYYRGVVRAEGLRVRTFSRLVDVEPSGGGLNATLEGAREREQVLCRRLVLATGYFDQPNPLDVPGEDLPHVSHYFDEPHRNYGLDVVVIGGKNSAVETALELFRAGARVTFVYRGLELPRGVKYWLRPDLENRIAAGEIAARFGAQVTQIDERRVTIRRSDGAVEQLPADRVFALTGYHPDFALFRRIGIALEPGTDRPTIDPATLETNVKGVYLAGSISAGRATSEIFIENGRFDGEKIFGPR